MQIGRLRAAIRAFCVLASASAAASISIWALAPSSTESAAANGDTRTLHLYHTHTGETIDATFRVDGRYDPAVLAQLNHFLRDWRNNDEIQMDPRLFDTVWEAYRTAGATDRIQIYSAYRSPQTNAMLRRRSHAVAEHSQHMLGKAMDTTMPGFPMSRVREAGMKLQHGGVGWYPSANFVHLDVGGVRSWPRMPYDQLARIFPDGKTVHISADGRTLPGYDQARLEIAQHGGIEVPPEQQSTGFFAWLFGGGSTASTAREDEEDRRAPVAVAAAPRIEPAVAKAPALAYASATPAQVQPLESGAGRQQVASLSANVPAADRPALAADGVLPLPPRRPTDLADAARDIPLPPVRPDSLDRFQTASIRYTDAESRWDRANDFVASTNAGVPVVRRSGLPPIITRGLGDRLRTPPHVLAFAAVESVFDPRPLPMPVARPSTFTKPLALRSGRRRASGPVGGERPVTTAEATAPAPLIGPKLTGLRRAAQLKQQKAAL